ncbi:response regulator transcription factor [Parahaliea maris]|uniref:Response regulator transcription factor n=1 Tax=Parahaliea maris TaxID=2716870 RepID=A0A5C9A5M2_9GAMM|nr:response regulator transcription factor [Parahaliea maris]TXS95292.1 response regulator transcription factor [Parahaliea maris]
MSEATPVVIADDHPLFRAALIQAVQQCMENVAILEADSIDSLLALVDSNPSVELVFLDLHMPGNDGFTGLTQLRNHYPDVTIIMVSSENSPMIMRRALQFGASAFIPKSADLRVIGEAISAVLDGDSWLPTDVDLVPEDAQADTHHRLAQQLAELTPQQYAVLSLISDGKLNKQIAHELHIKETTVKKHVSAILVKLGVNNRTQAGMAFQQLKLNAP